MLKRTFDIMVCSISLIIVLPLAAVVAALIKLTSKGPVIFKQRRIGLHKREFDIYKFRTMYQDAPANIATHLLARPGQFITPLGKFLRKSSLDELPQVFNILKGDMSIVGPRPALYNQYDLVELRDECGVNDVRPGITGLAQINGRDELPIPVKVEFDRRYVESRSLWLDVKIMVKTVFKVFGQKGVVEGANIPESSDK